MEQKPTVSFEKLMQAVAFGNIEDDVLTSLAGRLARMEHRLTPEDDKKIRALSGGLSIKELSHGIVAALNPDRHVEQAKADLGIAVGDEPGVMALPRLLDAERFLKWWQTQGVQLVAENNPA